MDITQSYSITKIEEEENICTYGINKTTITHKLLNTPGKLFDISHLGKENIPEKINRKI